VGGGKVKKVLIISKGDIKKLKFDEFGNCWVEIERNQFWNKEDTKIQGFELWCLVYPVKNFFDGKVKE
jgi:hypothetical protein